MGNLNQKKSLTVSLLFLFLTSWLHLHSNNSLNIVKKDSTHKNFFQRNRNSIYYHPSVEFRWQEITFYNASFAVSWIADGDDLPVNTFSLKAGSDFGKYKKENYFAPRFSLEYYWIFANARVSCSYLTNRKNADLRVSPEVGLGCTNFLFFNVGYDFVIGKTDFKEFSGPKFTFGINFLFF